MIPLYGFVEGDTMGLLILAQEADTVAVLAEKLQQAARVRVPKRSRVKVIYGGRVLEPSQTLAECGLEELERVDLVSE
jgi:hypothetical protein